MYYLSILVDNRKYHIVALRVSESPNAESYVPSFVVQREPGEEKTLFSIANDARLISHHGFAWDAAIDWKQLQTQLNQTELSLTLVSADGSKDVVLPVAPGSGVGVVSNGVRHSFAIDSYYTSRQVLVTIGFTKNHKNYKGSFVVHLAPQQQIFDVAMDFGSEASQIVINQRAGNLIMNRTPIVDNLLNYYYPRLKGKKLHQTADERELYRSSFFIKREGAIFNGNKRPGECGEEELLNLLTDEQDTDKLAASHLLVANLKLAYLGAYKHRIYFKSRETNVERAEDKPLLEIILPLQHTVIMYFMQMVLEDLRRRRREDHQLYLVLKLLVPNIFDQAKVSSLIQELHKSLAIVARENPAYTLTGWEITTLSESDASFLGFKREKEIETQKTGQSYWLSGKDYLVVDSGKGTTDFSIVRFNKDNHLASIYRSGFIGAGNYLSYAFVETVFAAIFGEKSADRQRAIHTISIENADIVNKIAFIALVEDFKKSYDVDRDTHQYKRLDELIPQQIADIRAEYAIHPEDPGLLGKIVAALTEVRKKQLSLKDEFGIINDTVNALVRKIGQEVTASECYRNGDIAKVILTGRAFKFQRLIDLLKEELKLPVDRTNDLKKICLLGAFSADRINFDSNLVGHPTVYSFVKTASDPGAKLIDTGASKPQVLWNQLEGKWNRWNEKMEEMFSAGDENFGDFRDTSQYAPDKRSVAENFFLFGETFKKFDPKTKTIAIGGIDYKDHTIGSGDINVFFTGEGFLIRSSHSSSPLGVLPKFAEETPFGFQTLYPFLDIELLSNVKVSILVDETDHLNMGEFD